MRLGGDSSTSGMATVERHWTAYPIGGAHAVASPCIGLAGDGVKESRGSVHTDRTSKESLPPIGHLDLDKARKETLHNQNFPAMAAGLNVSTAPQISPTTTIYPNPSQRYDYAAATATSVPPPATGYVSPSDSRRPGEDEKDQAQRNQQPHNPPQRQSLPSIHEALGNDNPLPYHPPSSVAPPTKPGPHPAPPSSLARPGTDGPSGPPNPFSNITPSTTPFLRENPFASHPPIPEGQRSSLVSINSLDSRNQSVPSLSSGKSPTQSSKNGAPSIANSQTSGFEFSAGPMSSPNGYASYPQSLVYQSQPSTGPSSLPYPPSSYENRPLPGAAWSINLADSHRMEEAQRPNRPNDAIAPHSETVKRHLDGYDIELSLNEFIDTCTQLLEMSKAYATRAHQAHPSGAALASLLSLPELDGLLHLQRRNVESLTRIRDAVSQEHALAEQRSQRQLFKTEHGYDDDHAGMYQEEFKGGGGFAGADAKKRRGKAAPPGRCHSCNRAETPEWRRGPDGARTLCNACGLHYAKLTRKMGANKASSLGPNLRPKSGIDPRSPTHP